MTGRKAYKGQAFPSHWKVRSSYDWGRRTIKPGDVLKFAGAGRGAEYRFVRHVVVPDATGRATAEWLDVVGGVPGQEMSRSFAPNRITKILTPARKRVRP